MTKPFVSWTVLPHGRLSQVDENILTVVGDLDMPIGKFPRRMTVVRLNDGRLVIFSAIALDENEMHFIEAFGVPTYLVVPSDIHRQDAAIWKARYPRLMVVAPHGARTKIEEVVPVDATHVDFRDADVRLVEVAGTEGLELALEVRSAQDLTLIVNDVIANMQDRPGWRGFLLRMVGFAGDHAQVPRVVQMRAVKDKDALKHQLEGWAAEHVKRIIVSHGAPIEQDADDTLRSIAASLN